MQKIHRRDDDERDTEDARHALCHERQRFHKQIDIAHFVHPFSAQHREDQSARDDRGDLSGDIDADRVHEQEVLVVLLQTQLVDNARRHRERRNARRTDHGVDLPALRQNQIDDLGKHDAARRVENEGDKPQKQDHQCFLREEQLCLHLRRDGEPQKQRDEICKHLLRRLGQVIEHAALADEVAEHQKADKRQAARGHQSDHRRDDDGKQNFRRLGHAARRIGHADLPLLLAGEELYHRRLHDRHERHI